MYCNLLLLVNYVILVMYGLNVTFSKYQWRLAKVKSEASEKLCSSRDYKNKRFYDYDTM